MLTVMLPLILVGCAGISYITEQYWGVTVEHVAMPDDTYRIYDKPAESKMMVSSSIGAAAAQGMGTGLAWGPVDNTPPKPRFDAAALQYLAGTGRTGCRVIDSYLLVKPQFEVKYDCTPLPPRWPS
jgi:hypothetical protein